MCCMFPGPKDAPQELTKSPPQDEANDVQLSGDSEPLIQPRLIPLQQQLPCTPDSLIPPIRPRHFSENWCDAQTGQTIEPIPDPHDSDWGPCPSAPPARKHWYFDRDMEDEIRKGMVAQLDIEVDQGRKRDRLKRMTAQIRKRVSGKLNNEARREREERGFRL